MAVYGIGAAAGGFADGFLKGRMAREQINSNKMEKQLNEERLKGAQRESAEAERIAAAREALNTGLQSLETDYSQGAGEFSSFMPEQMGVTPPAAGAPPANGLQQPVQPKSPWRTPADMYRDRTGAEGMYYDRMSSLYKNYYTASNQPDKALLVDNTLSEMREKKVDKLVKGAAAAMFVGAPEALGLLDRVSSVAGFGRVDTKSGTFDPETKTWNGIKMVQADGTETVRSFTPADMMSLAYHGDPAKHFEMLNEKAYRDGVLQNQTRGVNNESERLRLDGERISIEADQNKGEREDRAEEREARRNRENVDLLHKLVSRSIKPPIAPNKAVFDMANDQVADEKDRKAAQAQIQQYSADVSRYESRAEETNMMVETAQSIMAMNPGLKAQDAAYIIQGFDGEKKRGPDGRAYIEFNGQRILVP
jgi:hypothetical protein